MAAGTIDILIVEDNPGDARLIREMLKEGRLAGHKAEVAERLDAAISCVRERKFDIIILDLNLPDSAGLATIDRMTVATGGMVPVIILTGLSDEAIGESAIGHGVDDYLIKTEVNPPQLARSIRYAIERKKMEMELRDSEERYRLIFMHSMDAFMLTEPGGGIFSVNPSGCRMFGRSEEDICAIGRNGIIDTTDPRLKTAIETRARTGHIECELTGIRADGVKFPIEISSNLFTNRYGQMRTSFIIRNITVRKQAEEMLNRQLDELRRWQEVMLDREDRVIELKKEINGILRELGRPDKYGD